MLIRNIFYWLIIDGLWFLNLVFSVRFIIVFVKAFFELTDSIFLSSVATLQLYLSCQSLLVPHEKDFLAYLLIFNSFLILNKWPTRPSQILEKKISIFSIHSIHNRLKPVQELPSKGYFNWSSAVVSEILAYRHSLLYLFKRGKM